jgi:hypothetical protein
LVQPEKEMGAEQCQDEDWEDGGWGG